MPRQRVSKHQPKGGAPVAEPLPIGRERCRPRPAESWTHRLAARRSHAAIRVRLGPEPCGAWVCHGWRRCTSTSSQPIPAGRTPADSAGRPRCECIARGQPRLLPGSEARARRPARDCCQPRFSAPPCRGRPILRPIRQRRRGGATRRTLRFCCARSHMWRGRPARAFGRCVRATFRGLEQGDSGRLPWRPCHEPWQAALGSAASAGCGDGAFTGAPGCWFLGAVMPGPYHLRDTRRARERTLLCSAAQRWPTRRGPYSCRHFAG